MVAANGDYTATQVGALASTATLNAIATANATAADVAMNSHKITGLTNGSAAQDAAGIWRCTLCFSIYPCRILRLTTPTLDAIRAASAGLTAMFADMGAEDV